MSGPPDRHGRVAALALLVLTGASCSGASATGTSGRRAGSAPEVEDAAQTRAGASEPPPPSGLAASGWGSWSDAAAQIAMDLPERARWTASHRAGTATARHAVSGTRLGAVAWHSGSVVNAKRCESELRARQLRLPSPDPSAQVSERRVGAPTGYDTSYRLFVERVGAEVVRGTLLAFGANLRRCLAVWGETEARGRDAERRVLERLVLLGEGALGTLSVRTVDDRVLRPDG